MARTLADLPARGEGPALALAPARRETLRDAMLPDPFRVVSVHRETHDTFTLVLESAARRPAAAFAPGQFNMLYAFGVGEAPISISGDPATPSRLVHTTRAVGPVTRAICAARRGALIGVRGPYGRPWPVLDCAGRDIVIVAGGIGLAPLRPAVRQILANRAAFGRVTLLYGARAPSEILFRRDIEAWRGRLDVSVDVTVDRGDETWRRNVGVVTTLLRRAEFAPDTAAAFVCGPEVMMRFTTLELRKMGLSDDRIFVSMERNMKCGVGLCGHCQFGREFVCRDGPVFDFARIRRLFEKREV